MKKSFPRYMSPTINQMKKIEFKEKNIMDSGTVSIERELRKGSISNSSAKGVWKPQNNFRANETFDQLKPAPKLEKLLNIDKNSPAKSSPKRQNKLYSRLYKEAVEKDYKRIELQKKGEQSML